MKKIMNHSEHFWSKVDQQDAESCWVWPGAKSHNGYGWYAITGVMIKAHRFAFEDRVAMIPDDYLVLHTCDHPPCVNPRHLFVGTHKDNAIDRENKGRNHPNPLRGSDNPNSKLTEEQVKEIHYLGERGKLSYRTMGLMFNVSHETIRQIIDGKKWPHVKGCHAKRPD